MTYSADFRQRVLSIKEQEELSIRKTAKRFCVNETTIQYWMKGWTPKGTTTKKPTKIHNETLLKDIKDYPDDFQSERSLRLGVSQTGVSHALRRLKVTRKKRR